MKNLAFVGLGNMGLPMATNLGRAGRADYTLRAADTAPAAQNAAREAGICVADCAAAAAEVADAVITMLPAGAQVRELLDGADGLFARAPAGKLFIDCSTTSPDDARDLSARARASGHRFVDAPVSGGIGAARAATLSFLVGGDAAEFGEARPILARMGKNIFHAGGIGDGQAAKLCNNMLLSVLMIGSCEALALGEKLGLDLRALTDIMRASSGGNWVVNVYNPAPGVMDGVPAANNYEGGFMVDLMVKDSDLAMAAAAAVGARAPLGEWANSLYRQHLAAGAGKKDFASIYQKIQR